MTKRPPRAKISKKYTQKSIIKRIEAFFLDNLGKVVTREQIQKVATDPKTGRVPENWHQRVSELRTDYGYAILTRRDRGYLKVSEYVMPDAARYERRNRRARPTAATWSRVLDMYGHRCAWYEDGIKCNLREGDKDPVGGGTVHLTYDHHNPHSAATGADGKSVDAWRPLCARHQVTKRNYWDSKTGKLNVDRIIQSASDEDKRHAYVFLKAYFEEMAVDPD